MAEIMISNLDQGGERRAFAAHGHAVYADAGAAAVLRGTFEPGWRWSADVAPIAGTTSCQSRHLGCMTSGSMRVRLDDGTEQDLSAGDVFDIPAGHDAWVTSDVPCEMVDFSSDATKYAIGRPTDIAEADDAAMKLVRRGFAAFNTGDVDTLRQLLDPNVIQIVPGHSPQAGTYKGVDNVLGYYAKLGELTGGTFRAHLIDVFGDGEGKVVALHQTSAVRNGVKRVSKDAIVFTVVGGRATELVETHADLPGDDAFLS
ncbi:MAG TPA: nuclear transport factor 2 family protein [Nocardioidaceae bacterium]|nr:nuclear transport factor 2 family protein [Nocardioidaceae bacterium]